MKKKKIVIIGGGISGLAAAYLAGKNSWDVTVLEASSNVGGLLNTFNIAGTRLEFFYHHFFTHDAELLWLLKDLNIDDKIIFESGSMGFYRDGKIFPFNKPLDLLQFRPLSFVDKLRFGLTSVYLARFCKWENMENIPALDWFYKYAGKSVTDSIWKPMIDVKFGYYAKDVPTAWMVGRLAQRLNSRSEGEEKLGYLNGSLSEMLEALLQAFKQMKVKIVTEAKVEKLLIRNKTLNGVKTSQGIFRADTYLSTIPTHYLADVVEPSDQKYATKLRQIEYFGAVCTIIETKKKISPVYWLNVADPGFPFGGVIEQTNLVPSKFYNGSHIIYLSRYFSIHDDIYKMDKKQIEKVMMNGFYKLFPKVKKTDIKKVYLFRTNTAATVCDLNFSKKVPKAKTPIKKLYIGAMPHIYPDERSCNNSIRVAAEVCRIIGMDTSFVPKNQSLSGKVGMS